MFQLGPFLTRFVENWELGLETTEKREGWRKKDTGPNHNEDKQPLKLGGLKIQRLIRRKYSSVRTKLRKRLSTRDSKGPFHFFACAWRTDPIHFPALGFSLESDYNDVSSTSYYIIPLVFPIPPIWLAWIKSHTIGICFLEANPGVLFQTPSSNGYPKNKKNDTSLGFPHIWNVRPNTHGIDDLGPPCDSSPMMLKTFHNSDNDDNLNRRKIFLLIFLIQLLAIWGSCFLTRKTCATYPSNPTVHLITLSRIWLRLSSYHPPNWVVKSNHTSCWVLFRYVQTKAGPKYKLQISRAEGSNFWPLERLSPGPTVYIALGGQIITF